MNKKIAKRFISLFLVLSSILTMQAIAFAADPVYDLTSEEGSMITTIKMSESEGFKVSIPAEATMSWATGELDTSIVFSDVLLASGHTLKFNIYGLSTDYDSDEHKLVLKNSSNNKIYLDVIVDDADEPYDGENSTIFTISKSVASETHKVSFSLDKDFVDESENTNYPVTGTNYSGNIVYNIIIN